MSYVMDFEKEENVLPSDAVMNYEVCKCACAHVQVLHPVANRGAVAQFFGHIARSPLPPPP